MDSKLRLRDGEQKVFFKAGGEWCYLWTPGSFSAEGRVPVVIHHHGARGYVKDGSADWLEEENKVSLLRAVMEAAPSLALTPVETIGETPPRWRPIERFTIHCLEFADWTWAGLG